ncbi:hypothetical protein K435DRAFT_809279 [Dendrothele bispora CBS 962.96]|uniref:Helicase C-terminal domain-containing protein n=1 Tax=Dendrothele bispora (strain CBS 962.96) TaxID=1314807 RepID=A0A4S8KYR9_DENBC|nr:hypothetical protein K435DRAFT_809279 [Dendrothele bispora CBS 962.96]
MATRYGCRSWPISRGRPSPAQTLVTKGRRQHLFLFHAIPAAQEKFLKGGRGEDECPGRDKWRSWITKQWDKWEIHLIVVRCLQEADVHPISVMVAGESLEWPNSTFCLPSATPELARALFGPEAFDSKGVLPAKFRQYLVSIGQRSWDRLRQRINKQKDRIHLLEESALAAFTALSDNKLTTAKVARVIKLVSEWRDVAQIFGTKRNLEVADNMLAELDHTLEIAGAKVAKTPKAGQPKKRLTTLTAGPHNLLANDADITYLRNLYMQYFESDDDSSQPPITESHEPEIPLEYILDGDLGMEEEAKMDPATLSQRLGFKNHLPYQFNSLWHCAGATPWDSPDIFERPDSNDLTPLRLHWHQEAGVHSILRSVFAETPQTPTCTGMLIAGEVGLGKTALCLSTIAALNQLLRLQETSQPLPPVLRSHQFLNGSNQIPALSHEIKTVFRPRSIDIFIYDCPKRFLTVNIDEAHEMRNVGVKYYAAMALCQKAQVKIAMTGTPLLMAPKDIASIGRLLGLDYFVSEQSVNEAKDFAASTRRAKKLDDDNREVRRIQIDIRNESLLDLPAFKEIIGIVNLTARELDIIKELAELAKSNVSCANELAIFLTKKFYLEYRMAVAYAKLDPSAPYPIFKTIAEWEPIQSTKMTVTVKICAHYLSADHVDDVQFVDGELLITQPAPFQPGQVVEQECKIIIYAEFPSITPLLKNVLEIYGMNSLCIDGSMPYDKRDQVVSEFRKPGSPRIFIFSHVGSAGLNLAIANIVIFIDQPWSAQDERQIRGRAHRQPQKSTVKAIHFLANESSDVLMSKMAQQKLEMHSAFSNKVLPPDKADLLRGKVLNEPEEDEEDNVDRKGKKRACSSYGPQDEGTTEPGAARRRCKQRWTDQGVRRRFRDVRWHSLVSFFLDSKVFLYAPQPTAQQLHDPCNTIPTRTKHDSLMASSHSETTTNNNEPTKGLASGMNSGPNAPQSTAQQFHDRNDPYGTVSSDGDTMGMNLSDGDRFPPSDGDGVSDGDELGQGEDEGFDDYRRPTLPSSPFPSALQSLRKYCHNINDPDEKMPGQQAISHSRAQPPARPVESKGASQYRRRDVPPISTSGLSMNYTPRPPLRGEILHTFTPSPTQHQVQSRPRSSVRPEITEAIPSTDYCRRTHKASFPFALSATLLFKSGRPVANTIGIQQHWCTSRSASNSIQ